MKRQKVFVCAAVIAIVVLLGALALALYALGKCPRHCEFPEFCEELTLPLLKDDAKATPVTQAREFVCPQGQEVVCPQGEKFKISFRLAWTPDGILLLKCYDSLHIGAMGFSNYANSDWTMRPILVHGSVLASCGRHDYLFYIIPDRKKSTEDELTVKVGIGYPDDVFCYLIASSPSSFWSKAWVNLRSAF